MAMELTIENREQLLCLLCAKYVVPYEMIDCVKEAVKQYSTKNYSDDVIDKMVRTPQSLSKGLALLRERNDKTDLSLFRGILTEWLVCAEYNALKNKGAVVMTITNPDPSSKADLLHIINTGNGYKAVPGPDVKSGGSTYVFNQWKKIVQNRYEIPMVDVEGILTTEKSLKQLTKKQKLELEKLKLQYPNKKPIATSWDKEDIMRVIADYLKFVEFDILPSTETSLTIKDINVSEVKSKLYSGEFVNHQTYSWSVFSSGSKSLFNSKIVIEKNKIIDNTDELPSKDSVSQNLPSYDKEIKIARLPRFIDRAKSVVDNGVKVAKEIGKEVVKWGAEHPEEAVSLAIKAIELLHVFKSSSYNDYVTNSEYESNYYDEDYETTISENQYDSIENDIKSENKIAEESAPHHARKHIRNLSEGQKASPEKIRTARENGFELGEGQTWVDDY